MKAGFGRSDITPRLGVQLAGYGPYRNRAARAVLAPLCARALAVSQRGRRAVVLSLELCGTPRPLARRIREAVADRIGCGADEVFLGATHTHSGPSVGGMFGWGLVDSLYLETLPARAADAAQQAWAARTEASWSYAEAPCEGIAVNRETDAGFAMGADFGERMDPRWRPARPQDTDPVVRVLAARDARGKLLGLLHHFGCHPVVCGEQTTDVHGDYAGLASLRLERGHPGSVALFLPGALGDINPSLNHRNPAESRRAVRALGRRYAAAVGLALSAARPAAAEGPALASLVRDATFGRLAPSRGRIGRRIARLERLFTAAGGSDNPWVGDPPLHTRGMEMARLEGLRSVLADYKGGKAPNRPVRLHGLRIGPLALLGCGIEVYHSLQNPSVARSPHPHTWVVSLVGGTGYAHDAAAQRRAGYSNDFVPLMQGELPYRRIHAELPGALARLARDLA
jgi:hypothetical protein